MNKIRENAQASSRVLRQKAIVTIPGGKPDLIVTIPGGKPDLKLIIPGVKSDPIANISGEKPDLIPLTSEHTWREPTGTLYVE